MTPLWYPHAVRKDLLDHSAPGTVAQRNLIVLHVSDGLSEDGGVFQVFKSSKTPNRVSAHFCIDRNGTVFQYLPISDTAWHASAVNGRSIGIEHVALTSAGANALNRAKPSHAPPYAPMPATHEQYAASATLVAWLCETLGIPVDATHVQGHNTCAPMDHHTLCPEGALSVATVIELAQGIALNPPTT